VIDKLNQVLVLKDSRNLGFAEYGKVDGFPIVYCHGSQSSRLEMHFDMTFAVDIGLRIITIDRPGHGLSDFNANGTILSFAADVRELVDHLKINEFSVVGMSAGSPFALAIAYTFPEMIHKVAIISGFAPFSAQSKQHLSKEVKVMLNLAKSLPFLLRMLLKIQSKQLQKNPQKALKGFLKLMSTPDQEVLRNEAVMTIIEDMFKEAFRKGSEGVAYEISKLLVQDWGFDLKDVTVPVSFWQGKEDNNVPYQWAELMSNEINNSSTKMFSDEGHLIIFNHSKEIFSSLK